MRLIKSLQAVKFTDKNAPGLSWPWMRNFKQLTAFQNSPEDTHKGS